MMGFTRRWIIIFNSWY